MNRHEGLLAGTGLRVAIVCARFNEMVTERLLSGALDCLHRHGVADGAITLVRVPGSFELPLATRVLAGSGRHDALICLGALVRGETPHFEYLASQVTTALGRIAYESGVPVAFGVLTCDSLDQALNRSGAKAGNKGWEAALSAIEMANLMKHLGEEGGGAERRV